jgi:hypothetical protein
VEVTSNVISLQDHFDRRWAVWIEAQNRAQQTQSIEDGKAAGRAWRRWLELFMTPEQRDFLDSSRGGMIG